MPHKQFWEVNDTHTDTARIQSGSIRSQSVPFAFLRRYCQAVCHEVPPHTAPSPTLSSALHWRAAADRRTNCTFTFLAFLACVLKTAPRYTTTYTMSSPSDNDQTTVSMQNTTSTTGRPNTNLSVVISFSSVEQLPGHFHGICTCTWLPYWFLQRISIACYAERCISYDRFCPTVRPSDRLTVRPSVTVRYHAKTTPATIMRSSLEDSPMILVSWRLTSAQNSKGNIGSEGAEWERGSKNVAKIGNF